MKSIIKISRHLNNITQENLLNSKRIIDFRASNSGISGVVGGSTTISSESSLHEDKVTKETKNTKNRNFDRMFMLICLTIIIYY